MQGQGQPLVSVSSEWPRAPERGDTACVPSVPARISQGSWEKLGLDKAGGDSPVQRLPDVPPGISREDSTVWGLLIHQPGSTRCPWGWLGTVALDRDSRKVKEFQREQGLAQTTQEQMEQGCPDSCSGTGRELCEDKHGMEWGKRLLQQHLSC